MVFERSTILKDSKPVTIGFEETLSELIQDVKHYYTKDRDGGSS